MKNTLTTIGVTLATLFVFHYPGLVVVALYLFAGWLTHRYTRDGLMAGSAGWACLCYAFPWAAFFAGSEETFPAFQKDARRILGGKTLKFQWPVVVVDAQEQEH